MVKEIGAAPVRTAILGVQDGGAVRASDAGVFVVPVVGGAGHERWVARGVLLGTWSPLPTPLAPAIQSLPQSQSATRKGSLLASTCLEPRLITPLRNTLSMTRIT